MQRNNENFIAHYFPAVLLHGYIHDIPKYYLVVLQQKIYLTI